MKRAAKAVSLILVLVLFALMALGSGSGGSSEPSGESAGSDKSASSSKGASSSKKDAYEVGEGKAVVYADNIGTTWVQISVPVKNTGDTNLYLSAATMDLEDSTGHLVDSKSLVSVYPQVIKPGETAWYYEETTLDETPSSELAVVPHVDVKSAKVDCVRYEVSDVSLINDTYGGIKVTGRVENTTDKDESGVYVVILFYDKDDALLGQAFTIMTDELKAGEKMGFSATTFSSYDAFRVENVARYEVYAYTFQYQFG